MTASAGAARGEILVVDDAADEAAALAGQLSRGGYQTRLAGSGEVALWSALRQPPDLILLSVNLPGLDAGQTCRSLKAHAATASIPVIFITGLTEADPLSAFEAGAVDLIRRPFAETEVLARVSTHVGMARTARRLLDQQPATAMPPAVEPRPNEILVVEDTPESLCLLATVLTNAGYTVREAPNGELALWSALRRPPDLVLLDIRMPGLNGFDVCKTLKSEPATAQVPVIFLSALSEISDKEAGFAAGAVDFVTKPFSEPEVLARVRAHLRLAETVRTATPSVGDPATAWQPARTPVEDFDRAFDTLDAPALLVDGAGQVSSLNPALRKMIGDAASALVGQPLAGLVDEPASPLLAPGGGRGTLHLPAGEAAEGGEAATETGTESGTHTATATVVCDLAGATVRRVLIVHSENNSRLMSPCPAPAPTSAAVHLPASATEQALEAGLREALGKREFHLHYQPIVQLASGQWLGAEALLRWRTPARGWVMPEEFMALAEDTGDIVTIGAWVTEQVCAGVLAKRAALPERFAVSINLCALEFWQDSLSAHVESALRQYGIPGAALSFDIDLRVLEEDPTQALSILRRLKELGVGLTIDGWANGAWPAEKIAAYPVDSLKLARPLTKCLLVDADQRERMQTALRQARQCGLRTMISGIESAAAAAMAQKCGFDLAQGFHWAGPLEAAALTAGWAGTT